MAVMITINCQAEYSIEHMFEVFNAMLDHNHSSISLYICGSPQLHLFQVFFVNIVEENLHEIAKRMWNALYVDEWEDDNFVIEYESNKIRIQQLYNHSGMRSLNIIRHSVNFPQTP